MKAGSGFVLDLRDEGRAGCDALGPMPELTDSERTAAIDTWKGRMVNEHISSRVFAALLPQLMRAGVSPRWQATVADAISEELSHGRQCAAVVTALGGDAIAEVALLEEVPEHADACAVEAALRNLLSISCLSETVAVALIGAERLRSGVPTIEKTLANILSDEVRHARMGWSILEELSGSLDEAVRHRLNRYLVVAFRHLLAHELAHLPKAASPSERAEAVGVCDGYEGRALFFDTVQTVIVPRLQMLGFEAQAAWQQAGGAAAGADFQSPNDTCAPAPKAMARA